MHPDEISELIDSILIKKYNCYDNANYNDEALKKCTHLKGFYSFFSMCDGCCNRDICEQYAIEAKKELEIKLDLNASIFGTGAYVHRSTLFDEMYEPRYFSVSYE